MALRISREIVSKYCKVARNIQRYPAIYGTQGNEGVMNRFYSSDSRPRRPAIGQAENLLDIGTRDIFSDEHDMFRETCRKFFKDAATMNSRWEEEGKVPKEVWEHAGSLGLLGVATPAECHGVGGDFLSTAITWEEQQYAACVGLGFSVHSDVVMPYLSNYGTPEQQDRYLPEMTAGRMIGAICMTEPNAGSDVQGFRTRAVRSGSDYILNGSKVFISNGINAEIGVVVAVTNPEATKPAYGLSLFLVELNTEGVKKGRNLRKMGLKSQDTAEIFFEDVRVPASQLLGPENAGFKLLMQELPRERLLIADLSQSGAEWAFEETRRYVKERKLYSARLADLQAVQHKLAELKTEICIGRAFVDQCLELMNEGQLDSASASMAKYWITEMQVRVVNSCVQLHGGSGYMSEYPICRAYTDARIGPIWGGPNEVMKELIGRTIVRK